MTSRRDEIVERIREERVRQFNLPGSEFDARNTPNDWAAIASHYLNENVRRGGNFPDKAAFEASLIKAAAVIIAALEHSDTIMKKDFR
jgi:hypothetical protein